MLLGVAVIVTSLAVSALAAVLIDTAYQAIVGRWPVRLGPIAVTLAVLVCLGTQGCVTDRKLTPPDHVLDPRGR
jgi:hypothetical protein